MRRFLWIWLALLGAYWATRTAISALVLERADLRLETLVQFVAVPTLQAVVVWWMTRAVGSPQRPKAKDSKDLKGKDETQDEPSP